MKRFTSEMRIEAPVERVWAFYSDPANLPRITLPRMHLRVVSAQTPLRTGSRVVFSVRRGPVTMTWESRIAAFDPPRCFVDELVRGPFDRWTHRHEFEPDGAAATRVRDTIEFGRPKGLLGHVASALFIEHEIQDLFRYRETMTKKLLAAP